MKPLLALLALIISGCATSGFSGQASPDTWMGKTTSVLGISTTDFYYCTIDKVNGPAPKCYEASIVFTSKRKYMFSDKLE